MFSTHQRTGYLFLALILGHFILISAQVGTSSGTRVLEAVTFGLFSEIQRTVTAMVGGVRQVWDGYVGLRGVRAESHVEATASPGMTGRTLLIDAEQQGVAVAIQVGGDQLLDLTRRLSLAPRLAARA